MTTDCKARCIDTTGQARPAILIAGPRTGGTFLCCCLSNHPQIFCTRGEPLHWGSRWLHAVPDWKVRFDLLMRQPFYKISIFKAMDHDVFAHPELWEFLLKYDSELRILYLERENILYQAASHEINRLHRQGDLPSHPTRTFVPVDPEPCELDPKLVLQRYQWIKKDTARNRRLLAASEIPVLYLIYEEMSVMDMAQSSRICEFLGVRIEQFHTDLKKIHIRPYEELVTNWPEIEEACGGGFIAKGV